jgi:N utilization substance protein B
VSLAERLSDREITVREFSREIVLGVRDNAIEIDRRIATLTTSQWPIDRMPRIDRCLARMAIYELDYTGIDARAAISEALELADELSTDDSVAFLNGLLGRAAQTRPGRKADGEQ